MTDPYVALERQQLSYEREREIDQEEIERLIALRRDDARVLKRMRALLDEAVEALRDRNHDTQVGEKWREDSRLETWFPLTAERLASLEQWARDCRDQVLFPAAQREDAIGKAADGLGQAMVEFRLGPNTRLSRQGGADDA